MQPSIADLQSQLERLAREVTELRGRLDHLESGALTTVGVQAQVGADLSTATVQLSSPTSPEVSTARAQSDGESTISLAGRTAISFGGAFLLRAFTDAHLVSPAVGATLGLLYAAILLFLAYRDAGAGRKSSATFHGLTATTVAFPLIGETATRLQILPPGLAAIALVAFTGLGLYVAWRQRVVALAWLTTLFAVGTALALLRLTGHTMPFVGVLFVVCIATEALAFDDDFRGMRWPASLGIDLALLLVVSLAVRTGGIPEGYQPIPTWLVIVSTLALAVLYMTTIGARTLVQGRHIQVFGLFQGPMALLIGFYGASRVLAFHGSSEAWVGAIAVVLGAGTYGVAFANVALHADRIRNFYFYSTLGGLLMLAGMAWIFDGSTLGIAWAGLAVAAMGVGVRWARKTLQLHASVFAVASAVATGLAGAALDGFTAAAEAASWRPVTAASLAATAAALICYVALATTHKDEEAPAIQLTPNLLLGVVSVVGVASLLSAALAHALHAPGAGADAGFLAAGRTAILSAGAVALAAAGRHSRTRELHWLVWPVLVACGLKMLIEDFPHGRPASQVLTLAAFGAALIIAPRLLRARAARPTTVV